jgi:hypothetical protein
MEVRTLGIDLAKNLFTFTVWMGKAGRSCSASSDAGSCCRLWRSFNLAWWRWRRAAVHTFGLARLPSAVTRSG